uniref:Uncharacterized protein n=1 Tax=Populus davidiana TaxID=266767 RepID=A0A6M2F7U6_9ROSI
MLFVSTDLVILLLTYFWYQFKVEDFCFIKSKYYCIQAQSLLLSLYQMLHFQIKNRKFISLVHNLNQDSFFLHFLDNFSATKQNRLAGSHKSHKPRNHTIKNVFPISKI